MSGWTQPICERDFFRRRLTAGDPLESPLACFDYEVWEDEQHVMLAVIAAPVRMKEARREPRICCDCGKETEAGIFVRLDPDMVRFPHS